MVLVCSAVNYIDSSAAETLAGMVRNLRMAGVRMVFAEVKGPVMDQLERSELLELVGMENVFLSTHLAVESLVRPRMGTSAPAAAN
jgi:sulfate permease, SulP family